MDLVGVVSRTEPIGGVWLAITTPVYGVHVSDQDAFVEKEGPIPFSTTFGVVSPSQCSNKLTYTCWRCGSNNDERELTMVRQHRGLQVARRHLATVRHHRCW